MGFKLGLAFGLAVVFIEPWCLLLLREFSFFLIKLWANCRSSFPFGVNIWHGFFTYGYNHLFITYGSPLNKENIYLNFLENLYEHYNPLLFDICLTNGSYHKTHKIYLESCDTCKHELEYSCNKIDPYPQNNGYLWNDLVVWKLSLAIQYNFCEVLFHHLPIRGNL